MSDKPLVLLVDDNRGMLETLSDIIGAAGFEVDTADDARVALEMLRQKRYAVGVFDVVLPGFTGIEMIRRCRREKLASRFVVITAYVGSAYVEEAEAEGVDAILGKPLDPGELVKTLRGLTRPD